MSGLCRGLPRIAAVAALLSLTATAAVSGELRPVEPTPAEPEEAIEAVPLTPSGPVPDQYIVVFKDGVANPRGLAVALARQNGIALGHVYVQALKGFSGKMPAGIAQALAVHPSVAYVEQDIRAQATGILVEGVDRIDADLNPEANIDGLDDRVDVDIAIFDSGIHPHSDLNVYRFYDCTGGGGCTAASAFDDNGHGTHVAGIVAALDDDVDLTLSATGVDYEIAGVAPGARLWGFKVLDANGNGTFADIIAAVDAVTANAGAIEVANMSLRGIGFLQAFRTAIQNSVSAGVVYVVAAGNDAVDVYGSNGVLDESAPMPCLLFGRNCPDDVIPASYPEVLTVSGMGDTDGQGGGLGPDTSGGTPDDSAYPFSNYSASVTGTNPVISPGAAIDLAAPGMDVLSTYVSGGADAWAIGTGTSMSSPHVAGAVALHIALVGRATSASGVHAIRQDLIDLAEPQSEWRGGLATNDPDGNLEGLVDVGPDNATPTVEILSPDDGDQFASGAQVTFTGSSSDLEDGDLSDSINWSSNLDGSLGTGPSVAAFLSDGHHDVTASVTDTAGASNSAMIGITVGNPPNEPPEVAITSPADGATFTEGEQITFEGTASDAEDGELSSLIDWNSDPEGFLGTGASVTVVLAVGTHTIIAEVTDSGSLTTTAQITVIVEAAPVGAVVNADSVTYGPYGGRTGDRHFDVFVEVDDDPDGPGAPVAGASVSVEVSDDASGVVLTGTGSTDESGIVVFAHKNAASGCYTTTITDISKSGYSWDGTTPANGYCKP